MNAEQYASAMKQLLPPGKLWRLDSDGELHKVFLATGDELVRAEARGAKLIEEADPRTTDELLPDFERVLELPLTGTLAERRARVVAVLTSRRRFRPVDFQTFLAPLLGQDAEDVVVIQRGRADAIAMNDDREIYRFFVYRDPTEPGTYDLEGAQDQVDRMAPEHTAGYVIESIDFLTDDEFSLTERDILGA